MFQKIGTLHTVSSLAVNSVTDLFLKVLPVFENNCPQNIFKNTFSHTSI